MPLIQNFVHDFLAGHLDGRDILADHGFDNPVDIAELCAEIETTEGVHIDTRELQCTSRLNDLSTLIILRKNGNRWEQTFTRPTAPTGPLSYFASAF